MMLSSVQGQLTICIEMKDNEENRWHFWRLLASAVQNQNKPHLYEILGLVIGRSNLDQFQQDLVKDTGIP